MTLYQSFPKFVEVEGRRYRLRPSFDRVIEAFEVLSSDWSEARKVAYLSWLLVRKKPKNPVQAVNAALMALLQTDEGQDAVKTFDFSQDAGEIYASFMQAYGIDLMRVRDNRPFWMVWHKPLHWCAFMELLKGLPGNTPFKELVEIRTMPVPKPTKYNQEARAKLLKAKAQNKLKLTEKERDAQYQRALAKLAEALLGMARKER